jgi:hypothetical protein
LNSGEAPTEPAPKPDDQMINDSENLEYGFSSDVKPVVIFIYFNNSSNSFIKNV